MKNHEASFGKLSAVIGGIQAVGPIERCLFYGLSRADNEQPLLLGNARGLAVCDLDRIAEMAAEYVSLWSLLRAKVAFWWKRGRRVKAR